MALASLLLNHHSDAIASDRPARCSDSCARRGPSQSARRTRSGRSAQDDERDGDRFACCRALVIQIERVAVPGGGIRYRGRAAGGQRQAYRHRRRQLDALRHRSPQNHERRRAVVLRPYLDGEAREARIALQRPRGFVRPQKLAGAARPARPPRAAMRVPAGRPPSRKSR